jgi:hypothetical protein
MLLPSSHSGDAGFVHPKEEETMKRRSARSSGVMRLGAALGALGCTIGGDGATSECGADPAIHVVTPGYDNERYAVAADVLLDRIVFPDGVEVGPSRFIYPAEIRGVEYGGPIRRLRTINGPLATVGPAGVAYIEFGDGEDESVSSEDLLAFGDRMEASWANPNLNNRVHLHAQTTYSFTVGLETEVWDSNFGADQRPELFIFEDQGNSVMTIQPLDEDLEPVGTPVEVRATDIRSISPSKVWVGRFGMDGEPQSGTYELKMFAIDLSRLGVTHMRWFRITNRISGGGEASADLKIIAVDTSPAPAAQTMTFD